MNEREHPLDDVAVYVLGALPPREAARVREHLRTCGQCRDEYATLRPAATALAYSEEACTSGENGAVASPLLKQRVMREAAARGVRKTPGTSTVRPQKPLLWPVYLVAAACLVLALISTVGNISLTGRLRTVQTELASTQQSNDGLARALERQRVMVADLMSAEAKHYPVRNGEIVTRGAHVYVALRGLPVLPKGKVYQAWTLAKGAKAVAPSVTFVPDNGGDAVVALPQDARALAAVAVSVEPEGGSAAPTTKPIEFARIE